MFIPDRALPIARMIAITINMPTKTATPITIQFIQAIASVRTLNCSDKYPIRILTRTTTTRLIIAINILLTSFFLAHFLRHGPEDPHGYRPDHNP